MKVFRYPQLSDEWILAHKGVPTASLFDKVMSPVQMKPSKQQGDWIDQLVADRLASDASYLAEQRTKLSTGPMADGTKTEDEARAYYSLTTGRDVDQVGFVLSDCGRFGCSPDGLVWEPGEAGHLLDRGLELKCPIRKTQIRYLREGGLPAEYKCQVHGGMIVTGAARWDFLSYCPGLPPLLLTVRRDAFTDALSGTLEEFLRDLAFNLDLFTAKGADDGRAEVQDAEEGGAATEELPF